MQYKEAYTQGRCNYCLEARSSGALAPPAHRDHGSLKRTGVELHSLTENINTTTPSGKLTFHIFAALAEFERDLLRQRVNAGLKAARRRGRVGGRPKALSEADLKKARALLRSGDYTKVQVAKELVVSRHTLWRALVSEATP